MRVFLVDDEPLARERLRRMLLSETRYQIVGEASEGQTALDGIGRSNPDIVLLDIRMPGMDGIAVAQQLAGQENPPAVVFCTAYNEHATEAFQVHAIGYLLKPVRKEALLEALENAGRVNRVQLSALQSGSQERRRQISVRSHRGLQLIDIDDIYFFMADQKYVRVRYGDGELLIDDPLKELETQYGDVFARAHRNALVSVNRIQALERAHDGHYYALFDGIEDRVAISRRCVSAVKQRLESR